jgi:tetratricopeptide (TPR) repeat protein
VPVDSQRRAAARYQEGRAAYAAGRYKDAIDCFREADALAPSPALSFNTALAYDKLLDTAGALANYREYLRRDPNATRADSIRKRIGELQSVLAERGVQQVTVQSDPPGATVVIDEKPLGVTPWTSVLPAGQHGVQLRLPGYSEIARTFELPLEEAVSLHFPLVPSSQAISSAQSQGASSKGAEPLEGRGPSPWPWLTLGAGAASFLTAGAFELMRQSAERRAQAETTQIGFDSAFRDAQADRNRARAFAGVGGALTVTGVILVFALRPRASEQRSATLDCDGKGCFGSWKAAF